MRRLAFRFLLARPGYLALAALAAVPCARAGEPVPASVQDLTKPAFDTAHALYDMADRAERTAGTVVAEVDGRPITLGEVGDAIRDLPASLGVLPFDTLFPGVRDQLIRQQALVIRAQHQGLDEDKVVRRRMKEAADRVLANELVRREAGKDITEQVLLTRYNEEFAGKPGPDEVHVRVIMLPTAAAAQDAIAQVQGGADFASLASKISKDTTAKVGGDLGFVRLDGLNAEIGAVAFSLTPGQVTPYPVRSGGSWFVVKVEARRRGTVPGFAAVRERLNDELIRANAPAVTEAALAGVVTRQYNITGREAAQQQDADSPAK